jgi:hypothetical protein
LLSPGGAARGSRLCGPGGGFAGTPRHREREPDRGARALFALFFRARTRVNRERLSEGRELLEDAIRLAELLGDRFWLPRLANTRGWVLTELGDSEAALSVNMDAAGLAAETGDAEAECMSRINAARDYLTLGDGERASGELQKAEAAEEGPS